MKKIALQNVEYGYAIEPKGQMPKLINQVHGGSIIETNSLSIIPDADGILTKLANNPVYVFTADCIPILLYSTDVNEPVMAIHCGWRGALNRIALFGINQFSRGMVTAILGPSIRSCCFEVKQDLISAFHNADQDVGPYLKKRGDRTYLDLVHFVAETQLKGAHIDADWNTCTYCSSPPLPSYRRNKATDPHIRSWISKKLSKS